jgi:1,2-diacylglycerol 3-beta-galactosyltransferase
MTKNIVILFSDAGGGHRSAGEAITEALVAQYGPEAQVKMVDGLKDYAPYPFNRFPAWYPSLSRRRRFWKYLFQVTDGEWRSRLLTMLTWPYIGGPVRRLVAENPADVYVIVHWIFLAPLLFTLGRPRPPVMTVVTDLISISGFWCHHDVDLCVAPAEPAKVRVLHHGMPAEKVRVIGLPVASRFCLPTGSKVQNRARVGWGTDRPVVLVVGGGEGMGPLFEISQAISKSKLPCELAVIAGRNQTLQQKLQAASWNVPAHIYGFVTNMPDLMRAADVIITKAGPGTICEAFNAGLPIILYDYVPGQEAGNVGYVVDNGAGVWAASPDAVVSALGRWIGPNAQPGALAGAAANAQKLARPEASRQIADLIWGL